MPISEFSGATYEFQRPPIGHGERFGTAAAFLTGATVAMHVTGSHWSGTMTLQRWMKRSTSLAAVALAGAAPLAIAQSLVIGQPRVASQDRGAQLFEWTGEVDREVQVVMRGSSVWTNTVGQSERPRARTRTYNRLPGENGQVYVQMTSGRGRADVIQQPSRQNDYTTIVRIVDDRSGSADYRIAAYWQGYSNGDVYGRGRDVYDNRDGRDDRDRDDRGRGRGRDDRGRDVYRGRDRNDDDDRWDRRSRGEALHWTGNVDGDLEIRLQNGRVDYRNLSGARPTGIRSNVGDVNRRQESYTVQINQGRGDVYVVQQPQQWNGYTTIIRVRDPQGGYGHYDFSILRR
jgi:hypothetical protein